jgi:hypothetical protein
MPAGRWTTAGCLGLLALATAAGPACADVPTGLPRYDLDIHLDLEHHYVTVREFVTWTNRHGRPAQELVFNADAHFQVSKDDLPLVAKTLELLRMVPSESLDSAPEPALEMQQACLGGARLPFYYLEATGKPLVVEAPPGGPGDTGAACGTALVVPLPRPVGQGESVTVLLEFRLRLPQRQGRWGQWQGVTCLCAWLPLLAVYDECGWQPTPFIPWHQPFFNEAGLFTARVTLPCDQKIGCTASVVGARELGGGLREVDFAPIWARDFTLLCSARYLEVCEQVGPVQVRCVALPEHEHYARLLVRWSGEALATYSRWFGPYPYPQFTVAEAYFGWNGNECAGLVMIDERVFGMPHMAADFVEYLISHEVCHQWWYNVVGTNGYCETWMDEALATYFSHLYIDRKKGHNNALIHYPSGLEGLPNIRRENYRHYGLYGTIARGECGPTVQEMPKYGHLVNLMSMCYDRGSKIVGMIADRLGEAAFFDFMRCVYARYQYRILRVADFQHELEAYTGQTAWQEFFAHWLYGAGMTDWCIDNVRLEPVKDVLPGPPLPARQACARPCKVTVLLCQKAELTEPTVLGFCTDGGETYPVRVPIDPRVKVLDLDDPPARVETLSDNRVRVEVVLPAKPTQITVDPDKVLVDPDPVNNYWKTPVRWHFTPLFTPLEEASVTNDYDRWNVTFGLGFFGSAYPDPWYTRSTVGGARAAVYRTEHFDGGAYLGYRTDYGDIVAGVDALWDHWPWSHTQIGFNIERSLTGIDGGDTPSGRGVVFGRYVFDYGSSLYLPPMRYVELFGTIQDHSLPPARQDVPGAEHFDHQTAAGIHYHINYLTPYWDPEGGFQLDATYANGLPIFGEHEAFERVDGRIATVKYLPDCLGPLAETRLAVRLYGGAALPDRSQLFSLGGSQLFRGFDLKERQGSLVWVGSLEWRVPLVRRVEWDCCDHLVGVRNVYGALFYDVGDIYVEGHSLGPVAHALGAGLRVDIAWVSLIEHTTLRFDVAKAVNTSAPVQFWFGLQHPF